MIDRRRVVRIALLGMLTAVVSMTLAFHRLGANSLFGDETIVAEVARNAAAGDQWYPLRIDGRRYVAKPPLSVWPAAAVFEAGGVSEFNTRAVSAAGGVIASMLLFALGTWLLDATAGTVAALLLLTAPPWLLDHGVREGVGDIWTAVFTGSALVAYVAARRDGSRAAVMLAAGAIMAGSLIKGPVIFLIVLCVGLAWEVGARVWHGQQPRLWLLLAVIFASALPFAAWVIENALHDSASRARLYAQFLGRHVQPIDSTHLAGPWLYAQVIADAFGWWLLALALPWLWRWIRDREIGLLLPLWGLLPVVVFSLSPSKLPWYADPALPALAMLIAAAIYLGLSRIRSRVVRYALAALVVIALAARIVSAWRAVNAPPHLTDMHRIALAYQSVPQARLYVDALGTERFLFREWNRFYLNSIPRSAPAIPSPIDRSRCSVVITTKPEPLLRRADFAGASTRQLHKYDPRETDLYVVDVCGGRFTGALDDMVP